MSEWLMKVIRAEADRLLELAADDAELRADLRALAERILAATQVTQGASEPGPTDAASSPHVSNTTDEPERNQSGFLRKNNVRGVRETGITVSLVQSGFPVFQLRLKSDQSLAFIHSHHISAAARIEELWSHMNGAPLRRFGFEQ